MSLSRREMLKLGVGAVAVSFFPALPFAADQARRYQVADPKRIYIAPDDHTDFFWSADENGYRNSFIRMLDYYLDQADATESLPSEFQGRWNCDGSFWLWTYEKHKTPAEFDRLVKRIRDGHISAPLNALVVCLGGAPAEAVLRGMYYAGKLERRHNLRFLMAIAMENQTLSLGLVSLWAGAGAKYSWKGICGCDTVVYNGPREHEIYWWTGLDGSHILMKWNSLVSHDSIGGYAEARHVADVIEYVDTNQGFATLYPYRVIGAFGKGWDDLETLTDEFVTVAQAKSNARRRVMVSNEEDFFKDFEATYGSDLPSVTASYGNEWDLYCAALAEVSASVKRSTEKLRGAEALATLVSLVDPAFMSGREAARDQAWMALGLYWEHNLGVVGKWDQFGAARVAWQRRLANEIKEYVDQLQSDAAVALGRMIQRSGDAPRFFVFNPLSWARTDIADLPYTDTRPAQVIDLATGEETPSQIVTVDGARYLRILARNVPSVGYKVFEIRPGAPGSFPDAASVTDNVIENDRYRITVAGRGAITSLLDKTLDEREFAAEIGGRTLNDLGPGEGTLKVENAGPVSVTLLATASGPLAHTSRITLIREVDRIDIRNDITQNFDDVQTWAFGFALDAPDVWHEEVGAVIRAKRLEDGGHYAMQNARYDWLTLNHFADISGADGAGVTLANADCYFMMLGNSAPNFLDTDTPLISVLAGGRVGGDGNRGIPNQGDDRYFLQRFALQTRPAYDPTAAMRFALEHQNPLIVGRIEGDGADYPETLYSLLQVSSSTALLWALKPSDDTDEVIARLWNLSAEPAAASLNFTGYRVISARQVTHIETPMGDATVSDGALAESLGVFQMRSFSLKLG